MMVLAQDVASDAALAARLIRDLPGFLRTPVSLEAARSRVTRDLERRAERFVALINRAGLARPRSVYGRLLRHAGVQRGDIERMVASDGLEGALQRLAGSGVRVEFDELSGRRDIVRGSLRIPVTRGAFDNPFVSAHYAMYSGGTGGRPRRSLRSLAFTEELAVQLVVALDANAVGIPTAAVWFNGALNRLLTIAKLGGTPGAWFRPIAAGRWAILPSAIVAQFGARLGGHLVPTPVLAESTRPSAVLDWIGAQRGRGRPPLVNGVVSACVRLAQAATDCGVDLEGVTCLIESEPVSIARRRAIEGAGARVIVDYSAVEASGMGYSCAAPSHADDVHVFTDRYAIIQQPRDLGVESGGEMIGDALAVTTLSEVAPTILINAELGDAATVTHRACGCPLESLGLGTHLSDIRSFEKLTGEGVTFARHGLTNLVEQTLPARFGGSALDYQLVEWETDRGISRLEVRVAPSVGRVDEAAVREHVLSELARGGIVAEHQTGLWRAAGTVSVTREAPRPTPAGKLLPFRRLTSR